MRAGIPGPLTASFNTSTLGLAALRKDAINRQNLYPNINDRLAGGRDSPQRAHPIR